MKSTTGYEVILSFSKMCHVTKIDVCVCMRVILDVCNTSVCLHPAPLYSSHSLYCNDSAEAWLLGAHGFHITAEGGGGMKNKTWQLDTRYHPLSEMLCEIRGLRPCFKR